MYLSCHCCVNECVTVYSLMNINLICIAFYFRCICGRCQREDDPADRIFCFDYAEYRDATPDGCPCVSVLPRILDNLSVHVLMVDSIRHTYESGPIGDSVALIEHLRWLAYTRLTHVLHGILGPLNRLRLSSCLKWLIRERFPDEHGDYAGFREHPHANPY